MIHHRGLGGVTAFITPDRYLKDIAAAAGVADQMEFYDELHLEKEEEVSGEHAAGLRPLLRA